MNRFLALGISAFAIALGGCTDRAPTAYGEANSIIVAVPDSLWAQVEDTVRTVLEPTIFTVRDERAFHVTQISPYAPEWGDLRKFRRILLIGRASDPWVEPALDETPSTPNGRAALVEHDAIWAGGQSVAAVVLPETGDLAGAITSILPRLHEQVDTDFRRFARARMFASGPDTALADSLRRRAGFSLMVPNVYAWSELDSATFRFLNTFPDASELIRSVVVTWRTGAADTLDADAALAWRDSLAGQYYEYFDQVTMRDRVETRRPTDSPGRSLEVAGIWSSAESDWPAAGPFISRVVSCPSRNRTYLLDAWLYAPGKDKYEYLIHLRTILDSFECG